MRCPALAKPGCASLPGSPRYFHALPILLPESLVIQVSFCSFGRVSTENFPSRCPWCLSVRVSVAPHADAQSPTSRRSNVVKMCFLLTPQTWMLSERPSTWSHGDASRQLVAHRSSGSPGLRQEFCIRGESSAGSRRRFDVSGLEHRFRAIKLLAPKHSLYVAGGRNLEMKATTAEHYRPPGT